MMKLKLQLLICMFILVGSDVAVAEPAIQPRANAVSAGGHSVLLDGATIDDREVYIVTSKIAGTAPSIGPVKHASIAICPKGVSPVVYENGVPVSNCRECELWGTQVMERGFQREKKRIGVTATKVCGISASTAERRMRNHCALNVPVLNDCRHHVIQVLGIRNRRGRLKRPIVLK